MSKLFYTHHFKKQYKKVRKNQRWLPIFQGPVPFEKDERSPWHYVIDCFVNDQPVPSYFYEHPITLTRKQQQQLRARLSQHGFSGDFSIRGLDLHFDGHNGDHLLLYICTNSDIIYLIGIGTHSDLF